MTLIKGGNSLKQCLDIDSLKDDESIEEDNEIAKNTTLDGSTVQRNLTLDDETEASATEKVDGIDDDDETEASGTEKVDDIDDDDDSDKLLIEEGEGDDPTSSSEEKLKGCKGTLLNQMILPSRYCENTTMDSNKNKNIIRYTVNEDNYYYFVFSSSYEQVTIITKMSN